MRPVVQRATVVAAVFLVVCAVWRPDVAVAVPLLALVFMPLERLRPVRLRSWPRPGIGTDVVHMVVDETVSAAIVFGALALARPVLAPLTYDLREHLANPVAWVFALVVGELSGYWVHRAQHRVPWLWRFHRVHHSSPTMDWLAPNRRHPVDLISSRGGVLLPLLLLGFGLPSLTAPYVVRRAQGLFVHANLDVHLGPLRWLVASPEFHHWHHAEGVRPCNFAGQVALVDKLFGTLHMPHRAWPLSYGMGETVPDRWAEQMVWPLQAPVPPAVKVRRPLGTRRVVLAGSLLAVWVVTAAPVGA